METGTSVSASAPAIGSASTEAVAIVGETSAALIDPHVDAAEAEQIRSFLQQLARRVDDFELTRDVGVEELFTPRFVQTFSVFDCFDDMLKAAGVSIGRSLDELGANDGWNRFVTDWTRFESWDEMRDEAVRSWIAGEIGLTTSGSGVTTWTSTSGRS